LLLRAKPIVCKWILRRKYFPDGYIEKYKARLIAKGFNKKYGLF
jgi:histone deacetylase 1/2